MNDLRLSAGISSIGLVIGDMLYGALFVMSIWIVAELLSTFRSDDPWSAA